MVAPIIVWFRQDLRLKDHPALAHAAKRGPVVPVFILEEAQRPWAAGAASRWWLHHSLCRLQESLGGLVLLRGEPAAQLTRLARQISAEGVVWNRHYEPVARQDEKTLTQSLAHDGIEHQSFPGSLLWEPGRIRTLSDEPFKVFTPFWRAALKVPVSDDIAQPKVRLHDLCGLGDSLETLQLLPHKPDWARGFADHWQPGETGADRQLRRFMKNALLGYEELRNRPDQPGVSHLSPHLHFGEISPRQIWSRIQELVKRDADFRNDADKFLAELGWREFSYQLLVQFPQLPERNWRPEFAQYPWRKDPAGLAAWQRGQTGYPFVDAGMRELWHTGYMHNRVRMITASFLIKHLRIHWREGEAWFWDTLVDADLANNAASWQWVAGSGADASPYFRIFNPIEQGRKFDPQGTYVRRWCPELAQLADEFVHAPFEAPPLMLQMAGVRLGETYPKPILEHRAAREAALEGYKRLRD